MIMNSQSFILPKMNEIFRHISAVIKNTVFEEDRLSCDIYSNTFSIQLIISYNNAVKYFIYDNNTKNKMGDFLEKMVNNFKKEFDPMLKESHYKITVKYLFD